jgi:hypothetical protein
MNRFRLATGSDRNRAAANSTTAGAVLGVGSASRATLSNSRR